MRTPLRPHRPSSRRAFLRTLGVGASTFGTGAVGARTGRANGRPDEQRPARGQQPVDEQQPAREQQGWRTGPSMPDERTEVGGVAAGSQFHVVGGFVPGGVTAGVLSFDPATEEWRTRDPLPETRHHAAVVALDDDIYVVGGFRGDGFDPVDTVWRHDGDGWVERAPLPAPRGALAAGVIDGRIYAVGGEGVSDGDDSDGLLAMLTVYDPETDEWTELASMPTARNHLAAGATGGRLYAVGGRTGFSDLLGATEVYDPESDEWTERAPMPTPRGGLAGTVLDGRVVAVGGEGPDGTFEQVEVYDPQTDEWESLPPLPTPRHGLAVAALGGSLYAAAGGPEPGLSYSNAMEVYGPQPKQKILESS